MQQLVHRSCSPRVPAEPSGEAYRQHRASRGDTDTGAQAASHIQDASRDAKTIRRCTTHHRAVVGRYEQAEADTQDCQHSQRQTKRGAGHERQSDQRQSGDGHASYGRRAWADAIGQCTRDRRHHAQSDRHRRERQPGLCRALAKDALEIEGDQEQTPKQDRIREESGDEAAAERPHPQQSQVDQRRRRTFFNVDKYTQAGRCQPSRRHQRWAGPTPAIPVRESKQDQPDAWPEQRRAQPVESLRLLCFNTNRGMRGPRQYQPRKDGPQQAKWNCDKKYPLPAQRIDEKPSDRRPDRQPDRLSRALHPDGSTERPPRDSCSDDRYAVGLQHGRADRLPHSEHDQPAESGRQSAQARAGDKHHESPRVEHLSADQVAQPSKRHHERRKCQQVGNRHPLHAGDRRAKDLFDRR